MRFHARPRTCWTARCGTGPLLSLSLSLALFHFFAAPGGVAHTLSLSSPHARVCVQRHAANGRTARRHRRELLFGWLGGVCPSFELASSLLVALCPFLGRCIRRCGCDEARERSIGCARVSDSSATSRAPLNTRAPAFSAARFLTASSRSRRTCSSRFRSALASSVLPAACRRQYSCRFRSASSASLSTCDPRPVAARPSPCQRAGPSYTLLAACPPPRGRALLSPHAPLAAGQLARGLSAERVGLLFASRGVVRVLGVDEAAHAFSLGRALAVIVVLRRPALSRDRNARRAGHSEFMPRDWRVGV